MTGNDDKRRKVIEKARIKYILSGLTNNTTIALQMYLENDAGADEQIPLMIAWPNLHPMRAILIHIRPLCDDCGAELYMQLSVLDTAGKRYSTAWTCKKCGIVYYSDKTPAEWLEILNDENRRQNISTRNEPNERDMPAGR